MGKLKCSALLGSFLIFTGTIFAGDAYYIDVRSQEEFDAGHVSSATLIPHDQIAERIGEVSEDKAAEIYVYCRSGNRSGKAKKALEDLGYTNVVNLGSLEEAREHASRNASSALIYD